MTRSTWKGAYIGKPQKKLKKDKNWTRKDAIPFSAVGLTLNIHNGKTYKKLFVTREKVGFYCGDFVFCKGFVRLKEKKKKNG